MCKDIERSAIFKGVLKKVVLCLSIKNASLVVSIRFAPKKCENYSCFQSPWPLFKSYLKVILGLLKKYKDVIPNDYNVHG